MVMEVKYLSMNANVGISKRFIRASDWLNGLNRSIVASHRLRSTITHPVVEYSVADFPLIGIQKHLSPALQ